MVVVFGKVKEKGATTMEARSGLVFLLFWLLGVLQKVRVLSWFPYRH